MLVSQAKTARDITLRMLCVGALVYRRELELSFHQSAANPSAQEDLHLMHTRLRRWIDYERLHHCLTEAERTLIYKPMGEWTPRALHKVSWRLETLGVLLWALRLVEWIPTFDTRFTFAELADALDVLQPTIDLVWCAELRSPDQLTRMRDTAELWDWRCHAAELMTLGVKPSQGVNYRDVIRVTAEQAHADGTLPALLEGDFAAFGRPFASISPEQYHLIRAISAERYSVMCWLMEPTAEWQSLPSDL
jgi:hypothetical protein